MAIIAWFPMITTERLWNSTIVIAASCRVENRSLLSSRFPFLILILDTEPNPIVFFSNTKSATLVIPLLLKRNGHHFQCLGDRTSSDGWSFPPFYWLNIILTLTFAWETDKQLELLFLTFQIGIAAGLRSKEHLLQRRDEFNHNHHFNVISWRATIGAYLELLHTCCRITTRGRWLYSSML